MNNLIIKSLNHKICIQTDSLFAKNYFLTSVTPYVFIPGYKVSETKDENPDVDITIKHQTTTNQEIYTNFENNKYLIFDNWEKKVPPYILTFIHSSFNNLRLKEFKYSIHSSAVQGNRCNFLLTGRAGVGKTSNMLEMVTKYGFKYISNNRTIVEVRDNKLHVLAGTKGVTIRDKTFFGQVSEKAEDNYVEMYGRIGFMFKDKFQSKLNANRKTVILQIRVNPGVEEFNLLDNEEATIFLYPFLLESVDREVLLFNWVQPVPITRLEYEIKSSALKKLKDILSCTEVFHLSGSMDFICKTIINIDNGKLNS